MGKVNLKELAKILGVSVSTVSKALRGSYEIGNETKEKIVATEKKWVTPQTLMQVFYAIIKAKLSP